MYNQTINASPAEYALNQSAKGRVKIWRTGFDEKPELVMDAPNLIVKGGADVLAAGLSGKANSSITHFYVGYNNSGGFNVGSEPGITVDTGLASFLTSGNYGYVRIPLAFPASYLNEAGYTGNIPYFTSFLTTGGLWTQSGATLGNSSKIFALGLVNAQNSSNDSQDRLFSKLYLNPVITYDTSHGLAITWGITFRALPAV